MWIIRNYLYKFYYNARKYLKVFLIFCFIFLLVFFCFLKDSFATSNYNYQEVYTVNDSKVFDIYDSICYDYIYQLRTFSYYIKCYDDFVSSGGSISEWPYSWSYTIPQGFRSTYRTLLNNYLNTPDSNIGYYICPGYFYKYPRSSTQFQTSNSQYFGMQPTGLGSFYNNPTSGSSSFDQYGIDDNFLTLIVYRRNMVQVENSSISVDGVFNKRSTIYRFDSTKSVGSNYHLYYMGIPVDVYNPVFYCSFNGNTNNNMYCLSLCPSDYYNTNSVSIKFTYNSNLSYFDNLIMPCMLFNRTNKHIEKFIADLKYINFNTSADMLYTYNSDSDMGGSFNSSSSSSGGSSEYITNSIGDMSSAVTGSVSEMSNQVSDSVSEMGNQVSDSVVQTGNQVSESIQESTNEILSDSYDESDVDIKSDYSDSVSDSSVNGFLSTLTSVLTSLFTYNNNEVININLPLPFTNQDLVLRSDFIWSHLNQMPLLYNLIQSVYYFVFGFYFFRYMYNFVHYIKDGGLVEGKDFKGEAITSEML